MKSVLIIGLSLLAVAVILGIAIYRGYKQPGCSCGCENCKPKDRL